MTIRFSMLLKVSLLLTWLLAVDKSEHLNRHLTSRGVLCFREDMKKGQSLYRGIEFTASTFSENFVEGAKDSLKRLKVKFTLKIFNISGENLEKPDVVEDDQLSTFNDLTMDKSSGNQWRFENLEISQLLGLKKVPCVNTNSVENLQKKGFEEKYGTLLNGIVINLTLKFDESDTHNASTFEEIFFRLKSQKPGELYSHEGEFPVELDLMSMLKKNEYLTSVNTVSCHLIDSSRVWDVFKSVDAEWIKQTEDLLMSKDLASICTNLDTLRNEFKIITYTESRILRHKWFLSSLSEEPEHLRRYYFEGLKKVYDPFRSVCEYYLDQPEREVKKPSMCSELLIAHLKSKIARVEKTLGRIQKKTLIEKCEASPDESETIKDSKPLFLQMLSKSVESKQEQILLIEETFKETHGYFEKIVQEYQGIQDKSKLTGNPLQSLDWIFEKLSEPLEEISLFSNRDFLKFFKVDQGCVLKNYLELCNQVTKNRLDTKICIPGILDKQGAESLEFVKTPIVEIMAAFDDFLRLEEFRESESKEKRDEFDGEGWRMSENIDSFLKTVRHRCARTFYSKIPYNVLREYIRKYNVSEEPLNFEEEGKAVYEIVIENLKKIVGPPGAEGAAVKFYDVLIRECFDYHYENSKKIADISTFAESGAQSILSEVLEKLTKEMGGRRDNEGVELLQHLIVIGGLIDKLLIHSKKYRYLEELSVYYMDMSRVSRLVCKTQEEVGYFDIHASNINETIQKIREKKSESRENDIFDDDSNYGSKKPKRSEASIKFEMNKIYK